MAKYYMLTFSPRGVEGIDHSFLHQIFSSRDEVDNFFDTIKESRYSKEDFLLSEIDAEPETEKGLTSIWEIKGITKA